MKSNSLTILGGENLWFNSACFQLCVYACTRTCSRSLPSVTPTESH